MRRTLFVAALMVWAGMGITSIGAAQTVAGPTIHSVTLREDEGVLTITGIGFGQDLLVTVDGQPVPRLQGGTETRIEVQAPAAVVTVPGTYRLTIMDPSRQAGDAFIVASHGSVVVTGGGVVGPSPVVAATGFTTAPTGPAGLTASVGAKTGDAPGPLTVIEDGSSPYRTAIGYQALVSNTTGLFSTASGAFALNHNTTGDANTASGAYALHFNTTGSSNTATGLEALFLNTTGSFNTATGTDALASNTTGVNNTATGRVALVSNTTGVNNTASGAEALRSNTTGNYNTASGAEALFSNTTGVYNMAGGYRALRANTTGSWNAASGYQSLVNNTTGFWNTGSGAEALFSNTTGSNNTASGYQALTFNTTGTDNTASGVYALTFNTTGRYNTADGSGALDSNTTGGYNTASGYAALLSNTTGGFNTALGVNAGYNATIGSYNLFLGAGVQGTSADTNTIRIGLPYDGTNGQNKTFIAGIYGTSLTGSILPVFVNASGQMGTISPGQVLSGGAATSSVVQLQQQVQDQQTTIANLQARLARLEELVKRAAGDK